MSKPSVLVLGPGLIGSGLVEDLTKTGKYDITVFLRKKEQAQALEKTGVKTVLGDLTDTKIIEAESTKADIIFNTLNCDDEPSVEATLNSLLAHPTAKSGAPKIFIHTSGAGVFGHLFNTHLPADTIWSDENLAQIQSLDPKAPHRNVDAKIWQAHEKLGDKVKIAIMIPATVYGPVYGTSKNISIQIPMYIRTAIKNGVASHGSDGSTIFTHISVRDTVSGFLTILNGLESGKADVSSNIYFIIADDEENTWSQVSARIGQELHKRGALKDAKPQSSGPRPDFYGNYRARSDRLKALGWKATDPLTVLDSVPLDVDHILSHP